MNLRHVELVMRAPCETYPDFRYLQEDEQDHARREQEAISKAKVYIVKTLK